MISLDTIPPRLSLAQRFVVLAQGEGVRVSAVNATQVQVSEDIPANANLERLPAAAGILRCQLLALPGGLFTLERVA